MPTVECNSCWERALVVAAYSAALLCGCGSQSDSEIPPGLLDAITRSGEGTSGRLYPSGPFGSQVGDIAKDVCFRAWADPTRQGYNTDLLARTCLSDFYRQTDTGGRLLLVNTAALWCAACRLEYGGTTSRPRLADEVDARAKKGLRMLGSLFQDERREPATVEQAARWAETFAVDFPFGLDDEFAMGAFANESLQPFNMLLDSQTMKILLVLQGDEPETLWPTVDALLSSASSE